MVGKEEVVFCTNLTGVAETEAEYALFMHEAEVFLYPLASAVKEGKMTADEARETFGSYRDLMPEIYDLEEMKEYENGFPGMDWFMLWAPGPGSEDFWREAYALGSRELYTAKATTRRWPVLRGPPRGYAGGISRGFAEQVQDRGSGARKRVRYERRLRPRGGQGNHRSGRKTEVDEQVGQIVVTGRECGVRTPVNAAVLEIMHEIESGERGMGWENLEEIARRSGAVPSAR